MSTDGFINIQDKKLFYDTVPLNSCVFCVSETVPLNPPSFCAAEALEERARLEEERRLMSIPAWKRQLLDKKGEDGKRYSTKENTL
jgi:hypothetical protein